MGKATDDLRNEHDVILRVIEIANRMVASDIKKDAEKVEYYNELIHFLRIFADKCHHGKEEHYFFDHLCNNGLVCEGGPIGILLTEHHQARSYVDSMSNAIKENDFAKFNLCIQKYGELLQSHIKKENNVIFFMADNLLDEATQDEIYKNFEYFEDKIIGNGVHEQLHSMIDGWEAIFN